ncbi:MAG: hypothetical protein ABEH81_01435 [Halopenitus sp.]
MPEKFAYGAYEIVGCYCPSYSSAAIQGKGGEKVGNIFHNYDEILHNEHNEAVGVVSSEEAKEAWDQAISEYREEHGEDYALKAAERIREDLWG